MKIETIGFYHSILTLNKADLNPQSSEQHGSKEKEKCNKFMGVPTRLSKI
jgi:hypothetical protein